MKVSGAPGGPVKISSKIGQVMFGSEGMIPYLQEHIPSGFVLFKNQPA